MNTNMCECDENMWDFIGLVYVCHTNASGII